MRCFGSYVNLCQMNFYSAVKRPDPTEHGRCLELWWNHLIIKDCVKTFSRALEELKVK